FSGSRHLRDLPSSPTRRSSDLGKIRAESRLEEFPHARIERLTPTPARRERGRERGRAARFTGLGLALDRGLVLARSTGPLDRRRDRKSTRLNSSHVKISYAVFC